MIEELEGRLPLRQRVFVTELGVWGSVYERGVGDSGHTVYGIGLDGVVFPPAFTATEVWHCRREDLVLPTLQSLKPSQQACLWRG